MERISPLFFVVCFDIVDDRIRYKIVKILKDYGYRVQKSVFECPDLSEEQFLKMKSRMEKCIEHTEDTVRFYQLCRYCVKKVEWTGLGEAPEYEKYHAV